jgi:hypothetical protein
MPINAVIPAWMLESSHMEVNLKVFKDYHLWHWIPASCGYDAVLTINTIKSLLISITFIPNSGYLAK